MNRIVNAAPMTIMLGTEDLSTRQVDRTPDELPQHLPKVYLFTKKGPTEPQLVVGDSRSSLYGEDSFDLRSKWANHQTVLSNVVNAKGNAQMLERLRPNDAKPPASIRLYVDVLETLVPEYKRNTDGTIQVDGDGLPVTTGQKIPGFKLKWVVGQVSHVDGESDFGNGGRIPGSMVNIDTNTQSLRYPIKDLEVPFFGEDGNFYGLRMWAPTSRSATSIDPTLLETEKVYPYRLACVYSKNGTSTPAIVSTQYAEQYVDVCLKPETINKRTDKQAFVGDVFIQAYQDLENEAMPPMYGPFGKLHVYTENIEELLKKFYAAEIAYKDGFSDFDGSEDEFYRFNMISGVSSSGIPYHSFIVETTDPDSVRLSENSTIYARGGSDGTMNDEIFAQLVAERVSEYANPLSVLQDSAKYPESIIYDSGFPLTTKYALCSFQAIRKDTAVVLATHTVGEPMLLASEDTSRAIALRARLQMTPESSYYGTPVMRGMVVGRSGILLNSQYKKRLPLTIEIAAKAAAYMGAGNGVWKSGYNFDAAPLSIVSMFSNISEPFTPATVRNKDWAAGLNWVQSYTRRSHFFPALKTIYEDDTSVLNSFFTMLACCELQKVGERAWREFSGVDHLTNAQLKERVEEFVKKATTGRFDDRFVIVPEVYFTEADLQRGYSWSLRIKIYAANMKTVMTMSVQAYRLDDLALAA